jgi:hypothetical protein
MCLNIPVRRFSEVHLHSGDVKFGSEFSVREKYLFLERLCCNKKKSLGVMLSGAKHLVFRVTCEDEILRLRLRVTLRQTPRERLSWG